MTDASISGFLLAGGQSTRMGSDKAFLKFGETTLLERALGSLQSVCAQVHIVGSMEKFAPFGSVIEDVIPQCGPLGGIYSALGATSTDRNLILAVDLPFMNASFLHYLTSRSAESDAVVTVPRLDGRWQPLCAVYRKTFRDHAQAALRDGNNRIDAVYPSVVVSIVNDAEIDRAGFSPELFRNLNTPEDWEQARHRL